MEEAVEEEEEVEEEVEGCSDDLPQDDLSQNDMPQDDMSQDDIPQDEMSQEEEVVVVGVANKSKAFFKEFLMIIICVHCNGF